MLTEDEDTRLGPPEVVPPLERENPFATDLDWHAAWDWLRAGWRDLWTDPAPSLVYGTAVFLLSHIVAWGFFRLGLDSVLGPALSGFLVIGPLIASGLYAKSREIEAGRRFPLAEMVRTRPRSRYQGLLLGLLLLALVMLWLRAAVLLYALHFGLSPFPGVAESVAQLFTTLTGWSLLISGSAVGALFAAFGFAVGVFSPPILMEEISDALSAMGISMAMVWNNLTLMLIWGAIVLGLFALCVATAFFGLIVVFPLLGHATWHAYRAVRSGGGERVFFKPA